MADKETGAHIGAHPALDTGRFCNMDHLRHGFLTAPYQIMVLWKDQKISCSLCYHSTLDFFLGPEHFSHHRASQDHCIIPGDDFRFFQYICDQCSQRHMKHLCLFYRPCYRKKFLTDRGSLQRICYRQHSPYIIYYTAYVQRQSLLRNAPACYIPDQDLLVSCRVECL